MRGGAGRVLAAAAGWAVGSQGGGDVSGTVTFNGRPVTSGTVQAVPADGVVREAAIGPDGSYALPDLPVGDMRVAVVSDDPRRFAAGMMIRREGVDPKQYEGAAAPPGWFPLPAAYADLNTASLAYPVAAGANTIPIELTGPAPKPPPRPVPPQVFND